MLLKIFYYFLIAASLLALLINRKRLNRGLYLFIPLLLLALLADGLNEWTGKEHWLHKFFFAIYTPAEYTLLCFVIYAYLTNNKQKKAILISIPFFVIAALTIHIWVKQLDAFYMYLDILIEAPLLCTWILFYFFQLATDRSDQSLWRNPMFVISIANLVFYSSSIFSYGFGSYLEHMNYPKHYSDQVYHIAHYLNLALYSVYLFSFSILCRAKKSS